MARAIGIDVTACLCINERHLVRRQADHATILFMQLLDSMDEAAISHHENTVGGPRPKSLDQGIEKVDEDRCCRTWSRRGTVGMSSAKLVTSLSRRTYGKERRDQSHDNGDPAKI